jgi:hypothetical protein
MDRRDYDRLHAELTEGYETKIEALNVLFADVLTPVERGPLAVTVPRKQSAMRAAMARIVETPKATPKATAKPAPKKAAAPKPKAAAKPAPKAMPKIAESAPVAATAPPLAGGPSKAEIVREAVRALGRKGQPFSSADVADQVASTGAMPDRNTIATMLYDLVSRGDVARIGSRPMTRPNGLGTIDVYLYDATAYAASSTPAPAEASAS